jgi:prephenate dehydratase
MKKVAIQGIKGSFHHEVAVQYFGVNIELTECMTFTEMPLLLKNNEVDVAVIAIENSIAGSLLPNYRLIDNNDLQIIGEVFIPIHHQLLALPGQTIMDITEVHSHPMALQQCEEFFEQYSHITLIESKDTAASAKQISKEKASKIGAIASKLAGNLYGLEIIESDIHTYKNNTTRFFVVQNNKSDKKQLINKVSLKLTLAHKVGSLLEILQEFALHQINLTKIQSLPIKETPFQYAFFIDIVFEDYESYQNCLMAIKELATSLKILGEYQKNNGL